MKQTEKYKLNLIEDSDTFSQGQLNENFEKIEAALTEARNNNSSSFEGFTGNKFIIGKFDIEKESEEQYFDIGFRPKYVIFIDLTADFRCMMIIDGYSIGLPGAYINDNGFRVLGYNTQGIAKGTDIKRYSYIAFD